MNPIPETTHKAKPSNIPLSQVILHSAIIIDGHTEATLSKSRIKSIQTMEWAPNGFLIIRAAKGTHILPSAAVKDSLVEEKEK